MAERDIVDRDRLRGDLYQRYGRPMPLSRCGTALRIMNRRDDIHPRDAIAVLYPSMDAAEAFAALNRDHFGHDVIGPLPVPAGALAVVDLRQQLTDLGGEPTDPALPDDWSPEVRHA